MGSLLKQFMAGVGGGNPWPSYCTPQNVAASVVNDTNIGVTWDAVSGATSYKIYYCTDGVTFGDSETVVTNSGNLTGLTADTVYFIRVASIKGSTECDPSAMVMERTDIAAIVGAYYVSPDGSGTTFSYAVPGNFNDAIAAANHEGDVIIFKRGTYTYSNGAQLDYKGVQANGVTIRGINRNPAKVVLDFNNSGDSTGWLYVNGRTSFTLRDITIKNIVANHALYLLGDSSGVIEHCYFYDASKRFITIIGGAAQGTWIIRRCIFSGIVATSVTANAFSIIIDGSSNPVDVDIQYNIFMPSAINHGTGIWLNGVPTASRSVDFLNNEFYGMQQYAVFSGGDNYTGNALNNIFAGCGGAASVGGHKAFEGNCGGYAATVDYNINMGSNQSPAYYDSQITAGAHDVDGNPLLKITKMPVDSFIIFSFDDAAGWNTTGWTNYKTLVEAKGWKMSSFINVAGWDTIYGGTAPGAELAAYIAAGHDVGCHSFSHTPLTVLTGAITLTYSGGGTKNVTILTDVVGGGADWNGILKDYTQWTGSLVLDVGGVGEDVLNLKDGSRFLTLEEVKTWVETHADWTATVNVADDTHISPNTLAISLANITASAIGTPGTALSVSQTPYLWLETKFAKDRMEAVILSVTGSAYTVKTWGSPFHLMSTDIMDAIMEAGYLVARGTNAVTGVMSSAWDCYNLAPYCIAQFSNLTSGDDAACTIENDNIAIWLGGIAGNGGIGCLTVHSAGIDHATEVSVWGDVFDIFEDYETMGVHFLSAREFADLLSGDNFAVIAGTAGNDLRLKYTHTEQFNGTKRAASIAIDAGIDVSITEDAEYVTVVAPPNIGAYEG